MFTGGRMSPITEQHIVLFLNDISCVIFGYGVSGDETAENVSSVFENFVKTYGILKQVISSHGTHFISVQIDSCPDLEMNVFHKKLYEYKVEHILARVKPSNEWKTKEVVLYI